MHVRMVAQVTQRPTLSPPAPTQPALVLLDNGAIITGGSLAATTSPLEEALAFARNKSVDYPRVHQTRVLWNAVKHVFGNIAYPQPQASARACMRACLGAV